VTDFYDEPEYCFPSEEQNPGHLAFVVDGWLHPSMYTEVPDPSRPDGYEQAVRQRTETQWAAIREAQSAVNGAGGNSHSPGAGLRPADPGWPARVQAAWDSYRQAQTAAGQLNEAADRPPEAWPDEGQADTA
jgi:hypothetical protein